MTENVLLQATNLHRYYATAHAVQGVSLELRQGEILGLLGPNGAGKSTTMQMLAGVLAPSAGSIVVNGHDLLADASAAKRQIGYLPELPPLYPELSVDEYLHYAAQLRRIKKSAVREAVDAAKQRCGLKDAGKRLIGNLSKGYQQRVGIAQAIVHQPAVIILDEPTVGLDPIQIREIRQLIRELGEQHGVILSTHILPEVQAVCNRVQIIHNGKLVFSENMAQINAMQNTANILVSFVRPPQADELMQLPRVTQVDALAEGRFRLHGEFADNIGEAIAAASVQHNWGLRELMQEKRTLEQMFVDLTSGDILREEQAA